MKEFLEAGKIVGTQGVRGEVRAQLWCDGADFLKGFKTLYFNEGKESAELLSVRARKDGAVLSLSGVDSVSVADELRGRVFYIKRADAALPEGRYFMQDLIGLSAFSKDGDILGTVSDVFETAANDVYEITSPNGKQHLIPGVPELVPEIDLENGKMIISVIGGMFDDED